jgi:hypothetical protein
VNCPNCGTNNLDNATVCANCGRSLSVGAQSYTPPPPVSPGYGPGPGAGAPAGMNIPNYLWQSIVVTLCCCLPLGIVGIIFATQVNSKLAQGDTAGALEASRKAKLFTLLGLGIGLVFTIIMFVFNGAMIMNAVREAQANQ